MKGGVKMSSFKVVRKQFLTAPRYTLSFRDRLYLSASACSFLGIPIYVKLSYDKAHHTIAVRKASVDEVLLERKNSPNPCSIIGSVGSDHRIAGVFELRRLIQTDIKIYQHFMVSGTQQEDALIFDLEQSVVFYDGPSRLRA